MNPRDYGNGKIKGLIPEFEPDATPTPIVTGTFPKADRGVIVQALKANLVSIFVGDLTVTEDTGLELVPGGSMFVAVSSPGEIYAVCGTAGQKIRAMVL